MCYVWSLEDRCITVFDTCLTTELGGDLAELHLQVASSLKRAMRDVISNMFEGCNEQLELGSLSVIQMDLCQEEW